MTTFFMPMVISTHAPRTGSDVPAVGGDEAPVYISTHAPRTGSDPRNRRTSSAALRFQPTLPARGATGRAGRRTVQPGISTHAPRTGSDTSQALPASRQKYFNPRSPHGERRRRIPAPTRRRYFNPRSPHGERRRLQAAGGNGKEFQPTLPARGATPPKPRRCARTDISTHAPRTGSDKDVDTYRADTLKISTHAPRTGSDRDITGERLVSEEFQPTLPARGATGRASKGARFSLQFQPTLPARGATFLLLLHFTLYHDFNPRSPHGERHAPSAACRR